MISRVLLVLRALTGMAPIPASRPCWRSDPPYPAIPEIHPYGYQSDAIRKEIPTQES